MKTYLVAEIDEPVLHAVEAEFYEFRAENGMVEFTKTGSPVFAIPSGRLRWIKVEEPVAVCSCGQPVGV